VIHVALELLTTAGLIAATVACPPQFAADPLGTRIVTVACETGRASPSPAWSRLVTASHRPAPGRAARLAVGIGASLAWDIADLPRRNAPLPEPIARLSSPGGFPGGPVTSTAVAEPGGAIAQLLDRWNRLYPPYAIQSWDIR
jgi:hypothetical protein